MMNAAGAAGGALSRRQTSKGPLTEPTLPHPRPPPRACPAATTIPAICTDINQSIRLPIVDKWCFLSGFLLVILF